MQSDISSLLMLILLMENSGCEQNINELAIMFLLMQNRDGLSVTPRLEDDGYTF